MKYAIGTIEQAGVDAPAAPERALKAVICGSFTRDPEGLNEAAHLLEACGCAVLSPLDLDFVGADRGFVFAEHERHLSPSEVEARHLEAMQTADFIWLHAPDGYVGRSASMELGYAHALGLPMLGITTPDEPALAGMVDVVDGVRAAVDRVDERRPDAPARGLAALQKYYERVARNRGWEREGFWEALRLLQGEVSELADAVRQSERLPDPSSESRQAVLMELADVQLYVIHLANILRGDLGQAVVEKEIVNESRAQRNQGSRAA